MTARQTNNFTHSSKAILYCRLPGLLALAARTNRVEIKGASPIVVTSGRLVRDACPLAMSLGVKVGSSVVQARRLCPTLLAIPIETVDYQMIRTAFLDIFANLTPIVEPDNEDAVYADITGISPSKLLLTLNQNLIANFNLKGIIGLGPSRLAAHACAESGVGDLAEASVDWLWPDDPAVTGRLKRLGLTTFGQVAELPEEALRLHFGKISPLLHRRSFGEDLTPVRALYPPPCADALYDCSEAPIDDRTRLATALSEISRQVEQQLHDLSGFGRRISLFVTTDKGEIKREWVVPMPIQKASDIQLAANRLMSQIRLSSPIVQLRILVEDITIPKAHTPDLFGVRGDSMALDAVRKRLASRFGLTSLTIVGQRPKSAREKRRSAVRESHEAFGRAMV